MIGQLKLASADAWESGNGANTYYIIHPTIMSNPTPAYIAIYLTQFALIGSYPTIEAAQDACQAHSNAQ